MGHFDFQEFTPCLTAAFDVLAITPQYATVGKTL
jgi:hypothetical protein